VRRFHEGILRQDATELDEVTVGATNRQQVQEIALMERLIFSRLSQGYRIRLQDVERAPSRVDVTVFYYAPDGTASGNVRYAAVKTPLGWKVDVHKTWQLWNSMFRPSAASNG
jgi:hypothetical protein